ncbi:MAG: MFS transporter [Clostridia bacterium]
METAIAPKSIDYSRNVYKLYVFQFLISFQLWIPIFTLFLQQERGISMAMIATMEGLAWIVAALSEVPTGALADKKGRKVSLIVGGFLLGPVIMLYGIVDYFPMLLLLHLLWNAFASFISGADSALLYDSLKASGRAGEYSRFIGRQMAILQFSGGCAGLLGAWLAKFWMPLPFVLTGLSICLAGLVASTLKEPPVHAPDEVPAERMPYVASIKYAVGFVWNLPLLRNLMLLYSFLTITPFFFTFLSVQPYIQTARLDIVWLGPIFLALRGAAIAGSMASHRISAAVGKKLMLYGLPLTFIALLSLLSFVPVLAGLGLLLLLNFAWSAGRPFWNAMLNDFLPSAQRATLLSLQSLLQTLILGIFVPFMGHVLDRYGFFTVSISTALLTAVAALLLLQKIRRSDLS